jgi:hypothetical protein
MAIGIDNKEELKVSSIDKIQELMAIGIDNNTKHVSYFLLSRITFR